MPNRVGWWAIGVIWLTGTVSSAPAIEHDRPQGEPYQLEGRRLVFTTWLYVRPGRLGWYDEQDREVSAKEGVKAGPWEARFRNDDMPWGVRLVAELPRIEGPVIPRDPAWEGANLAVNTVIHEAGKYRMWAGPYYLESTDGRQWTKPKLGLVERNGSRANNLLEGKHGSVFVDPSAPPEERYKTVWHGNCDPQLFESYKRRRPWSVFSLEPDPGRIHAILGAVSPDGLRWKTLDEPISIEVSDTAIVAYYDTRLKKYVMYTRTQMSAPRADDFPLERRTRWHQFSGRRAIGRSETANFREFPLSQVILEATPDMLPTDTWYTNCKTTIPGAPDHHLLFPWRYTQASDAAEIDLFSSYDGRTWGRMPGSPVIRTGRFGEWHGGVISAAPNLVELPGGDWAVYCTGYAYPHKYPRGAWTSDVGMAIWPKGRLIALEAPSKGEFTTVSFLPPGTRLRINALTMRTGSVLVAACDFHGRPLPGHSFEDAVPVVGDQYRTPVKWKGGDTLGLRPREPLVLRFKMEQAKLYGLDFE